MRPVILVFVGFYLPGFKSGGPVRSIANLVEQLGDEFDFRVVTRDRDLQDSEPYPGVARDTWVRVGRAEVLYCSPGNRHLGTWTRLLRRTPHGAVYVNSLFDPGFSLGPLLAHRLLRLQTPTILAPRGELSPRALALNRYKKSPFVRAWRLGRFHRRVVWAGSSPAEIAQVHETFGKGVRWHVAPDMPAPVPPLESRPLPVDRPLRVMFLGRIAPMKNLDYALRVLAQCESPIEFDIWGPEEDLEYVAECKQLAEALPGHVRAAWKGIVDHSEVGETLAGYDLLFLPTRGENYGHVIGEAVSAGTTVLLSDRTPWLDMEEHGAGWALPLPGNEAQFAAVLDQQSEPLRQSRMARRERVHQYARLKLEAVEVLNANRDIFAKELNRTGAASAGGAHASPSSGVPS